MPHVIQTARIPMTATARWHEIGAFGAVGDWRPMLEKVDSEGNMAGATRTAHGADGSTQVERLQAVDANRHIYRYTMKSTPMPVKNYGGEFRIDDDGASTSTITWSTQFDVSKDGDDKAVEMVRGFLKAGTDNLMQQYGEVE